MRINDTQLEMQSLRIGRGGVGNTGRTKSTVDRRFASIVPTWVDSDRLGPTWNIRFKENRDHAEQALIFDRLIDHHQFQQAITGYKVAFDNECRDVRLKIHDASGGVFSNKGLKNSISKIQLWLSRKIDANTAASGGAFSLSQSSLQVQHPAISTTSLPAQPISPNGLLSPPSPNGFPGPSPSPSPHRRRISRVSSNSRFSTFSATTGTTDTAATSVSHASIYSYVASQSRVDMSRDQRVAITRHSPPLAPVLVLLIRKDDQRRPDHSLLGIVIDGKTELKKACECRPAGPGRLPECVHAHVQRHNSFRGGALDAYRVPQDGHAGVWNLAALGAAQRDQQAEPVPKLRWISITFDRPDEQAKFVAVFTQIKEIWTSRCLAYEKERDNVRSETIIEES